MSLLSVLSAARPVRATTDSSEGMAMPTMTDLSRPVTVGVDTHADVHVAAVLDEAGRILEVTSIDATVAGYRRLVRWAQRYGTIARFGIEGTGSYGAGLARFLMDQGYEVQEVLRPDRSTRRRNGKSDPVDAEAAARAVLAGTASGPAKAGNGTVEMIRVLRVARRSALKARTQAANQIAHLVVTAPEALRAEMGALKTPQRVERAAQFRPGDLDDPIAATKVALRCLARRHRELTGEIAELDDQLGRLTRECAPTLLALVGVGTDVAGALLVAAGDNPQRLHSEAGFAALCGVSPVDASSGKQRRHRLNRGGNRQANNALWRIALVRLSHHAETQEYAARRTAEGKTTREIMRCLKRYIAREVHTALQRDLVRPAQPLAA